MAEATGPAPLKASNITTTLATALRPVPLSDTPEARSASYNTDHMLLAHWNSVDGWTAPSIQPFAPLSISPFASALHYATTCFEGMKLYRGDDGRLRLFRPALNSQRMLRSATRIALPSFDPDELTKCIEALCAVEGPRWLPQDRGRGALYVRPLLFADYGCIAVSKPNAATLCVMCCPLSPTGPDRLPMKLLASRAGDVRSWPGGVGWAKVGINYGPGLEVLSEARKMGFNFILWLMDKEDGAVEVTESGAANVFVVMKNRDGEVEVVTPELGADSAGLILPGIHRRSVLELLKEQARTGLAGEALTVTERSLDMREIVDASNEGRLVEMFCVGTAVFVWSVGELEYRGQLLKIPTAEGNVGAYAKLARERLGDILYGRIQHEWGSVVEEVGLGR